MNNLTLIIFLCVFVQIWDMVSSAQSSNEEGSDILQGNSCGGLIYAATGLINYKLADDLSSGEGCLWTIRANNFETIQFTLLNHGFTADTDEVSISFYNIQPKIENVENRLVRAGRIGLNTTTEITLDGPLAYVMFYTSRLGSNLGTGFNMRFSGTGQPTNQTSYDYILSHNKLDVTPTGSTNYVKPDETQIQPVFSSTFDANPLRCQFENGALLLTLSNFTTGSNSIIESTQDDLSVFEFRDQSVLARARYFSTINTKEPYKVIVCYPTLVFFTTSKVLGPDEFTIQWDPAARTGEMN